MFPAHVFEDMSYLLPGILEVTWPRPSIYKDLYWLYFIYWLLHLFYYCTHGCVC